MKKLQLLKKLQKTETFSCNLNVRLFLESVKLFLHVFLCLKVILTKVKHKVTHNFPLKIRNILELITCPVKFETTCPSVIFLLAIGSRPRCLRYLSC